MRSPELIARRIADPNWADNPRAPAEYALLAVSATDLQGVRPGDDPLRFFRSVRPVARAGYSIFLFDLDTPEKRAVFREAARRIRAAAEGNGATDKRRTTSTSGTP